MRPDTQNQKAEIRSQKLEIPRPRAPIVTVLLASCFWLLTSFGGAAPSEKMVQPRAGTVDTPTITIAGASADTTATPTTAAHEAQINWTFGAVSGTYTTCTVQAKTSVDGTNWLTLGSAAAVTVTSNTVNQWTLLAQAASNSAVTTSSVSSTAALGFGQLTKFTFACTSYGTSAPVTISVIYR